MIVKKPTLILLAPINFGFNDIITKNARKIGWTVYDLTGDYFGEFKYSSLREKLTNTFRKTFFKDRSYKSKLKTQRQISILNSQIKSKISNSFDYALFIRPDLWDIEVISEITKLAKKSVCYQWDGFSRYPMFKNYLFLFSKTFVFDPKDFDVTNPRLQISTNFWFDVLNESLPLSTNGKILYIGTYHKERIPQVIKFLEFLKAKNLAFDAYIFFDNKHDATSFIEQSNFKILYEKLNYENMIALERDYSVILDFQNPMHTGLSFRHFEGLAMNKKVITDNPEVSKYDFFHFHNTYILNEGNWDGIVNFLELQIVNIEDEIKRKYTFSNWLNYVLDIKPFQSLDLKCDT
jgi:hypothetical protein